MSLGLTSQQRRRAAALLVIVAGVLAYANTLAGEFVWDDVSSVLLHRHVQDPSQFFQLFQEDQHAFGRGQGNFYRPLVAASFMLDFALSYDDPAGPPERGVPDVGPFLFHVTNMFWHIAASVLFLAIMWRLRAPPAAAVAAALLYVVHPLHTEAVAYISGRADPMAAAFMFAALYCALWRGPKARFAGLALVALFTVAGVLSKESAAMLPALLLLMGLMAPGREERKGPDAPASQEAAAAAWLWRLAPALLAGVIVGVYGVLRMTVLSFGELVEETPAPFTERVVETLQAFALYVRLIFVPVGLHMERTLDGVPGWTAALGLALFAVLLAALFLAWRRGQRRAAFGLAWFFVTWFPISGLIPLNAPMAEHWLYVPLAGFLWAAAELVDSRLTRPRVRVLAGTAVFAVSLVFLGLTIERNKDWRDNESIYRATLAYNPDSIRVQYNLAVTYEELLDNPPGARRHFERVLALYDEIRANDPEIAEAGLLWDQELEAHLSLGGLYFDQREYQRAINHYLAVMQVQAEGPYAAMAGEAAMGVGKCLLAAGQRDQALAYFDYAVGVLPGLRPEADRLIIEGPLAAW